MDGSSSIKVTSLPSRLTYRDSFVLESPVFVASLPGGVRSSGGQDTERASLTIRVIVDVVTRPSTEGLWREPQALKR